MTHPYLAFCPYLPVHDVIEFAGWELGPLEAFDGRWSAAPFEAQAKAFLEKFVDGAGAPVKNPSILCRQGHALDGALSAPNEAAALESAIAFGFLDQNPHGPKNRASLVGRRHRGQRRSVLRADRRGSRLRHGPHRDYGADARRLATRLTISS